MNYLNVNKSLFSLISLGLLVGLSNDAFAMKEEAVKRDQHFRQAKANTVNYAEEAESPLRPVRPEKRGREDENADVNLASHLKPKQVRTHKTVLNTRGFYFETDIPRLNLPSYHRHEDYDHYSVLKANVSYLNNTRNLDKRQNGK